MLFSAAAALSIGLIVVIALIGLSPGGPLRALELVALCAAGAALLMVAMAAVGSKLAGWGTSEADFERVVQRSERLAREGLAAEPGEDEFLELDPYDRDDFAELVAEALDGLAPELQRALAHVGVVVRDGGRRHRAYGMYVGDGIARDDHPDRIVIFRDTLLRDFGHDAELLRAQVTRTVRHELAHHVGFDELGVRGLGL